MFRVLLLFALLLAGNACRPAREATTATTTTTTTTAPVVVPADSASVVLGPGSTPRLDSLDAGRLATGLDSTFTGHQRTAVARAVRGLLRTRLRWGLRDTARVDTAGVRLLVYRDGASGRLRTRIVRKTLTLPGSTTVRVERELRVRPCPPPDPSTAWLVRYGRWLPLPGAGWRGLVGGAGLLVLTLLFLALGRLFPR